MATVYNAANVIVTVNGIAVEGFADGDFCAVERNSDLATHTVGADGKMSLSVATDRTGKATLITAKGGSASALLDSLRRKQDEGDWAGFAFDVINVDSGSTAASTKAWITTDAPFAFAIEAGNETWVLTLENAQVERGELPG